MSATAGTGTAVTFSEQVVEADGFAVRYRRAGDGPVLCCLHGAGGLRVSRGHELLAERHSVIAFEVPGFGDSPVNDRSGSMRDLARTMRAAIGALGIDRTSLWGTSFGGKLALWLAAEAPELVEALVLASPAAIRPEGASLPTGAELFSLLYAHPERLAGGEPPPSAEVVAKQQALAQRLIGPPRDAELEEAMAGLEVPTLVLFGTEDRLTPPELGRHYPALLPNAYLVLVYDAAHAIDADRPEAFAAIVTDFVHRREQFVVRDDSGLRYP